MWGGVGLAKEGEMGGEEGSGRRAEIGILAPQQGSCVQTWP